MTEQELKNSHIVKQIKKLKNKEHQLALLAPLLMDEEIWDAEPYVEHFVSIESTKKAYRIDLYYHNLDLAIEVDEEHHKKNSINDNKRETEIKNQQSCEFYRLKVHQEGFIHIDEIKKLKEKILNCIKTKENFVRWQPKIHDTEDAFRDYPKLIYVKKSNKSSNPFPKFQLRKDFHNDKDLVIAIITDSESQFADKNLKTIDCVYQVTDIFSKNQQNGYVEWSGKTISHSIQLSGATILKMNNNSYHKLYDFPKKSNPINGRFNGRHKKKK